MTKAALEAPIVAGDEPITRTEYLDPFAAPSGIAREIGEVPVAVAIGLSNPPDSSESCAVKTLPDAKVPVVANETEIDVPEQNGAPETASVVIVVCPKENARQKSVAKMVRKLSLVNVFFMYLSNIFPLTF